MSLLAEPPPGIRPRPTRGSDATSSRAFGLDLELRFPAPVLPQREPRVGTQSTVVELVFAEGIEAIRRNHEVHELGSMSHAGRKTLVIEWVPGQGIVVRTSGAGRYFVAQNGLWIGCAPPSVAAWYWQRLLVGQVLPLAAALRGFEPLHASAVQIGGAAVAFSGSPGTGKSSLAMHLGLRGCPILSDDVVAIRAVDGVIQAEPGTAMLHLRHAEHDALSPEQRLEIGDHLASSGKAHYAIRSADRTLALAGFFLLGPHEPGRQVIERVASPDPLDLLATTFAPYLGHGERLVSLLDLMATFSSTVPVFRVGVDRSSGAAALAAAVHEHATDLVAEGS